jgi:hypothetical protein
MRLNRSFVTALAGTAILFHAGRVFAQLSDGTGKPTVDSAARQAGLFHQPALASPQNPPAECPTRPSKSVPVSTPNVVSQPVVPQVVTQAVPVTTTPVVQTPAQQILVQPSTPQIVMLPAGPPTVSVAQPATTQMVQVTSSQPQNLFVQSPQQQVTSAQSPHVQSNPQQTQAVQFVQAQPQTVQVVQSGQQPMAQAAGVGSPGTAILMRCPGILDSLLGWLGQGLTGMGQRLASRGAPRQVMAMAYNPAYVQVPVAQQVQSTVPQQQVQFVQQPVTSAPPPVTASPQSAGGHHFGLGLFRHDD